MEEGQRVFNPMEQPTLFVFYDEDGEATLISNYEFPSIEIKAMLEVALANIELAMVRQNVAKLRRAQEQQAANLLLPPGA